MTVGIALSVLQPATIGRDITAYRSSRSHAGSELHDELSRAGATMSEFLAD